MFKEIIKKQISTLLRYDHDIYVSDNSVFTFKRDGDYIDWSVDNVNVYHDFEYISGIAIGFISDRAVVACTFRSYDKEKQFRL